MYSKSVAELIDKSKDVLIIQADNPDGDSLGSAIALEQILTKLNKNATMYCSIRIADHLHYLKGWSRVVNDFPASFDLAILVDTSSPSLIDNLTEVQKKALSSKPLVIIDHHQQTDSAIDFAELKIIEPAAATGQIIFNLAKDNNWELNLEACESLATSILSDSLGLSTKSTTSETIRIIADLVDMGVDLSKLDSARKEGYKKSLDLTKYKGRLLERIETYLDGQLVVISIPWEEIEKYSPLYNPSVLVLEDMRLVDTCLVAIAFKIYNDGRMSAKIRSNSSFPLSNKLAESFGGGGHEYSSGFKTTEFSSYQDLLKEVIDKTSNLIKQL